MHEAEQRIGLFLRHDEFDEDRRLPGEFEEMLFVDDAVATESGNRAERRAALRVVRALVRAATRASAWRRACGFRGRRNAMTNLA
jgi:hypothetical protein